MTRSEWAKMTPDQQRTKVAELCGWTNIRVENNFEYEGGHLEKRTLVGNRNGPYDGNLILEVPDYLEDLNAMYDAYGKVLGLCGECKTNGFDHLDYIENLCKVMGLQDQEDWCTNEVEAVHNATAAQRAEALVMTMEK